MNRSRILLSSIAALTILSSQAIAENTELEAVDVWETEIVSSSLNIGDNAIQTKQADHLSDLLRDLPGVDVGGTHSVNNRINIRGLQDENLDITIDGAKVQNVNMFHHIGNLMINPDILKKADIEVGTNSVVSGSLGGSVAFETKDGEDLLEKGENFGARLSTTYNSNDSLSGSITAYGKVLEDGDFMIYHNHTKKNNWENGKGEEKFGAKGTVKNTLVKYGHKLNDSNKIILSYDKVTDDGNYAPRPDFGNDFNINSSGGVTFPTEYDRDTITLKHELRLENTTVDTSLYSNKNLLKRTETWVGRSPRPTLIGDLEGEVKTAGLNLKAQTNLETGSIFHTFTYGGLYDKQTSKVKWNAEKYGQNEEAISKVLFIEDTIDFDNGLVLIPGIRYNMYDLDGVAGDISDKEPTYSLAAEYSVTDSLSLLASATTLFKGVEMVDVLASNRTSGSAANSAGVKSETGINKEIGFKYIENGALGADSVGFIFKYFNTDINDYIVNEWSAGYVDNYLTNAEDLELKGFEASFAYNKDNFNALVTYAKTETKYSATGLADVKDPGDSLTIGLDYDVMPNLALSWESLFMFKEKDVVAAGYDEKKSFNVHDIAMRWEPKAVKGLTVIAGVDNIFDEAYISHISENRTARGYSTADYEPGRSFKVTLSYKF